MFIELIALGPMVVICEIANCTAIDVDFNVATSTMNAWVDDE